MPGQSFWSGIWRTVAAIVLAAIVVDTARQIITNTGRLAVLEAEVQELKERVKQHVLDTRIPTP